MSYDLSGYTEVSERIALHFAAKYPEGSLQSELIWHNQDTLHGWLCKAYAYRTPTDERPGIGHAFEPVPGKTSFTKDSEAMNAETSAWGRAIAALGFDFKKIASANEVRNRQETPGGSGQSGAPTEGPAQPPSAPPAGGNTPGNYVLNFGQKHKGKTLGQIVAEDRGYIHWLAEKLEVKENSGQAAKDAQRMARELLSLPVVAEPSKFSDDDIPFG